MSVAVMQPVALPMGSARSAARSARNAYKPRSAATRVSAGSSMDAKPKEDFSQLSQQEQASFLSQLAATLYGDFQKDHAKSPSIAPTSIQVSTATAAGDSKSAAVKAPKPQSDFSKLSQEEQEHIVAAILGGRRRYDDAKLTSLAPSLSTIKTGIQDLFPSQIAEAERDEDGNWITDLTLRWQRHAQGYHNLGMWSGADAPLTEEGLQQARDLGAAFAQSVDLTEMKVADIDFVSTLNRCEATHRPIDEATKAYQASQKDLPYTNKQIWLPLIREQISSHDGRPGASHVDQSRQFAGSFWNAAGAEGTTDTWDGNLNESHEHVKETMYEALTFFLQTASEFTQHTGKSDVVLAGTAHADNGRQLATILHELAGEDITASNTGFFNTEIKDFHLRMKTDATTGEISLLPQDNGKVVKFGKGILPEFGRQYRDIQATNRRKQTSSMSSESTKAKSSKLSIETLAKLSQGLESFLATSAAVSASSQTMTIASPSETDITMNTASSGLITVQ